LDGDADEYAAAAAGADYYDNPERAHAPVDEDAYYEDEDAVAGGAAGSVSPPLPRSAGDAYGALSPGSASVPKSAKDWRIDFENTSTSLGMNKNIVVWSFVWKRARHVVELHHSTFGGKRKIVADGRIRVQEKKPFADHSRYDMRLAEGTPAAVGVGVAIRAAGLTAFTYELYVGPPSASPRPAHSHARTRRATPPRIL